MPERRCCNPLAAGVSALGGNRVGRAAISGWREVVRPALSRGARLWPFDGRLGELARPGLTVAETYPADAYAALGAAFRPGESKRRQADRAAGAEAIRRWAEGASVDLGAGNAVLADGFGPRSASEDLFDALIGLLAMIEVVDGRRGEMSAGVSPRIATWEGWIKRPALTRASGATSWARHYRRPAKARAKPGQYPIAL